MPRHRKGSRVPRASKERLRFRLYLAIALLDLALICLSFGIASAIRFGDPFAPEAWFMLAPFLGVFAGVALNSKAYSIDVLQAPRVGVRRAVMSMIFSAAVLIGVAFYLKISEDFSRLAFGMGTLFSLTSVAAGRWIVGKWIGNRLRWRFTNEAVLVDAVPYFPQVGEIVIFAEHANLQPRIDDPSLLDRVGTMFLGCDRVVLACPAERRADWTSMLRGAGLDVEVLAPELDVMGALELRRFGSKVTILVSCGPLDIRARLLKRVFDLAVALSVLVALAPLMLVIALAIKLESRGPVFFRQPRIGLGNRTFYVLKFRSMRAERSDHDGVRSTSRGDDRITRLGKFIRRSSLDELPQLLNVLSGDMSLVGPRPHAIHSRAEDQLFWAIDHRYWDRHAVKPGMTGLAQVRGYRGATEVRADLTNRLQADLEYLNGWSLQRDVLILLRTLRVLIHSNAF